MTQLADLLAKLPEIEGRDDMERAAASEPHVVTGNEREIAAALINSAQADRHTLLQLVRELRKELSAESLNGDAIMEIRRACAEIMGGNCAFVDDDFARCLYTMKSERDAALARAQAAETNDRRYRWLRDGQRCNLHITYNEHAANYCTASEEIANSPDWYGDDPPEAIEQMKATNTIWTVQEYPRTPIGFNVWNRSTLDAAIDAALSAQSDAKKEGE